ncbi:hypothetical protein KFL_000210490 [Klebsormidium nitens]|uniref:Folate receptor-like domain-containing protein n=1 Tax=Klebsormidium nitens TaxID=105231 RepID=A0A1Y1HPQ5_KLENI|nr:hypothetical protein KFL_000210490 [Klebsormidium nitens]|eukprot:GAQ78961.1 hypothetical protein KFL_000210490 [Klebsormidium nitens]
MCRSQGGRFPPYAIQGKEPRRVRGAESLSLCKAYKWKTCCGKEQTDTALLWLRKLATSGEAGADCLALWEVVECALCDPDVGVSEGPPVICRSLCDRLLDACGGAYFALDAMTQDLVPCGRRDLVCTTAAEWASSGAHFCQLAGFRTADDVTDDVTGGRDPPCFDGTRLPPPGGREEERRGKKKRESGFWDAAKKVRKKAGGERRGGGRVHGRADVSDPSDVGRSQIRPPLRFRQDFVAGKNEAATGRAEDRPGHAARSEAQAAVTLFTGCESDTWQ